jgi:iron complex outermembrane receptor protein
MKTYLYGFILCVALALPGSILAQENEKEKKSIVTMEEVVVTGTRTEQNIERIPANVTVIDEEEIENSNAKDVVDLLRSEEGVIVRDLLGNGKTSQVDLRGFGETGPYNTLVLVDGRRVNAIDLSGVDWTQIPLEQIERIEIVRGTGTVLYGDNAVGGVINIRTKMPSDTLAFSIGSSFGSYGRNKKKISMSRRFGNVGTSLFGSFDSTDGYRPFNEFNRENFGGKIVFDLTEFLSWDISGSYHKDDYDLPGPLTEAQYATDRKMNANPLDEASSEDFYLKNGFDLELREYGSIITDFSYRNRESEATFPDPTGVFPQGSSSKAETWSITPRYVWDRKILSYENTFIAGVDLYWAQQDVNSFGGFNVPLSTQTGISRIERDSFGLYFNDEFSILEDLILSFGARHEVVKYDLSQRDLSAFPLAPLDAKITKRDNAYSAGLTYLYGDRSSLFARANRSLRFPLTDEVAYIDWVSWKILANTDLEPQTGNHYELGVKNYFTSGILGNVTLFRADIDNELFFNPLTFSNENHPETLHQGIEIGIKAELSRKLTLFGNYTHKRAEFEKDPYQNNEIPAVPRHKANLGFRIYHLLPGLIFSTAYHYVGSRHAISDQANNFQKLDPYYSINARVSYQKKLLKAFIGVNNITNQKYAEYAVMDSFLTTRNFYPSPERNWVAGLEVIF